MTILSPVSSFDGERRPLLRFSPYAWAKLIFLRDRTDSELIAFGVSSPGDLLLVEDVCLVRQRTAPERVRLDDCSVADFFDVCVDRGLAPEQFARIWIHAHPGPADAPSLIDEGTFARAWGSCDWAVMVIVPRRGAPSARIRFQLCPEGHFELGLAVDFRVGFPGAALKGWDAEYRHYVLPDTPIRERSPSRTAVDPFDPEWDDETACLNDLA